MAITPISTRTFPLIALTLAAACWGGATVITKAALAAIPPFTLLALQLAVSSAFLWVIVLARRAPLPRGRAGLRLAGLGLLNPGLAYTFSLLGLARSSASVSALLWAAEPILILGLAWPMLGERPQRRLLGLAALAISGVLLVAGVEPAAAGAPTGAALIGLGVLCCALYTVLTSRDATDAAPLAVVALQQSAALALALLLWPIELAGAATASLGAVPAAAWLWAIVSGVLYYALAFWCYLIGLRSVAAGAAGQFLNLIPIFAIAGAYLFLGERLSAPQWAGAGLILLAVGALVMQSAAMPAALLAD